MYDHARQMLEKHDIRPSLQRLAIAEYLLSRRTHPTVEAIFTALAPDIPTLSRTTVYNTVSTLAARGAVLALDLDPGQTHYDGETTPHAHFFCTRCGGILDIPPLAAGWEALLAAAPPPRGAEVADLQLAYKGLCPECRGGAIKCPNDSSQPFKSY